MGAGMAVSGRSDAVPRNARRIYTDDSWYMGSDYEEKPVIPGDFVFMHAVLMKRRMGALRRYGWTHRATFADGKLRKDGDARALVIPVVFNGLMETACLVEGPSAAYWLQEQCVFRREIGCFIYKPTTRTGSDVERFVFPLARLVALGTPAEMIPSLIRLRV